MSDMIPNRHLVNECYENDEVAELLGLRNKPHADAYFHYRDSRWVVGEWKAKYKVDKAIEQLERTVERLKEQGRPVHEVYMVVKSLGREKRRFKRIKGILHEKRGRRWKPCEIDGMPIRLYYTHELRRG